ncbi:hypothetical protein PybrP1_011051 [[Pythium] brassicae (nom. inval.)]|nr:hypothetical protein PybrP1_011051 [[Pythium] brassicae (nom. inval.)]
MPPTRCFNLMQEDQTSVACWASRTTTVTGGKLTAAAVWTGVLAGSMAAQSLCPMDDDVQEHGHVGASDTSSVSATTINRVLVLEKRLKKKKRGRSTGTSKITHLSICVVKRTNNTLFGMRRPQLRITRFTILTFRISSFTIRDRSRCHIRAFHIPPRPQE